MSINDQLKQIIRLDKEAEKITKDAQEKADSIASDTLDNIRSHRMKVIDEIKSISQQNYQNEIRKAEIKKNDIIQETEHQLACIRSIYESKKHFWSEAILTELFTMAMK